MTELEKLAVMLAIEAPPSRGKWSNEVKVSWGTMLRLRKELDRLGFDWRKPREEYVRLVRARRHAKRQAVLQQANR